MLNYSRDLKEYLLKGDIGYSKFFWGIAYIHAIENEINFKGIHVSFYIHILEDTTPMAKCITREFLLPL